MSLTFAPDDAESIPLYVISSENLDAIPAEARAWADTNAFVGSLGQTLVVPSADGAIACALVGFGTAKARARGRFQIAEAATKLPTSTYHIAAGLDGLALEEAALGWLLAGYSFDRYVKPSKSIAQLKAPEGVDAARLEIIAAGEALTRDLINTPTADMGPGDLEAATRALADEHGALLHVTSGDDLLEQNFPMIHTVGRAVGPDPHRAPRLMDMTWGDDGPTLTLVGKGVCFDTGGLNIKPGASMGLMKKDMGGSATVLGLAHMIMALKLPLRLRVLIPAVENSIDGTAFRPQDILTSRKGLTVEINNTDAEGRLVLADALALADEATPDLVISMATLTGAARVAVGPDISPYFTNEMKCVQALETAAIDVADPVWRLPFHEPYEAMIEPGIADLDNAPKGGFAGTITAALFLRRFVEAPYMHFDVYGWQPVAQPARPKGGVGMGARAILAALPAMLDL
ncbi:leucyl aminopeptidase family protein [Loktanella sp. F6476L]|uniref:leucyl aminopeptidase family protein n=1 Tax=Loktanella sp. F6476L TaxID=2926405 RepID=UPI001FF4DD28|nr:leucyl aminopeptidase family protein [Loktanella sp. F6476L]MCK0121234.1 leucyl aminopeptidase family protein [Loktanella sp. F6476L]